MTPFEINTALALKLDAGWTIDASGHRGWNPPDDGHWDPNFSDEPRLIDHVEVPHFPACYSDLNACREVEKLLTRDEQWRYVDELIRLGFECGDDPPVAFVCAHASPEHKSEALVRALGLWTINILKPTS